MERNLKETNCPGGINHPPHKAQTWQLRYDGQCQAGAIAQARWNKNLGLGATNTQLRALLERMDSLKASDNWVDL